MDIGVYTPNLAPVRQLDVIRPREPGRVTLQIANTPELMDIVYRLRHDSYVAQGFMEPRTSGLFIDEWDSQPHFFSMLAFVDDRPAASARISNCSPVGPLGARTATTAMEIFSTEIINLIESFRTNDEPTVILETSRLTRHPDFSDCNSDPLFALLRATCYYIRKTNPAMLISAVRRHHIPFYKRIGFQKISDPRPYPKLKFETALMVGFRHSYNEFQSKIPIFQAIDERDSVFEPLFAGERVRIFDEMPARALLR